MKAYTTEQTNFAKLHYACDDFILSAKVDPLWWQQQGLMQTSSGYGAKLTTQYKVLCADNKERRVYCSCFSNVGVMYILVKGEKVILRDHILDGVAL